MEYWILLVLFCAVVNVIATERVISSFNGKIGPGNYSYFTLHQKGKITLILESLAGDADIYLSRNIEKPNYAEYDLQSTTCGLDVITVPKAYQRPLHIALFGYSQAVISEYKLTAIEDFAGIYEQSNQEKSSFANSDREGEETESLKSLVWTIVVGILKIIFEVVF